MNSQLLLDFIRSVAFFFYKSGRDATQSYCISLGDITSKRDFFFIPVHILLVFLYVLKFHFVVQYRTDIYVLDAIISYVCVFMFTDISYLNHFKLISLGYSCISFRLVMLIIYHGHINACTGHWRAQKIFAFFLKASHYMY